MHGHTKRLRAVQPVAPWPLTPDKRAKYGDANWRGPNRAKRREIGMRGAVFGNRPLERPDLKATDPKLAAPRQPYKRISAAGRHVGPPAVLTGRVAKRRAKEQALEALAA